MRVIAVDWSGAKSASKTKTGLWHAEAIDGCLVDIRGWQSRNALVHHLIETARQSVELVVGMDFSFSAPQWFMESKGLSSVGDLWQLAAMEAEGWLTACESPFWGRVRGHRPVLPDYFRVTDKLSVAGISPKSVFQIGGPGQVGTGSLRGWNHLLTLQQAGFAVWPFDTVAMPLLVEIYPRLMTGPVRKSSFEARRAYLAENCTTLTPHQSETAASCEDAFDAAVSALGMSLHQDEFERLPQVTDSTSLLEGLIWKPGAY